VTEELVDSHVHFWDQGALPYAWLAEHPALPRVATPVELVAEVGESTRASFVVVEADTHPARVFDEVRWVEALAAREPRIRGIVACARLDREALTLRALDALARKPLVRGVRQSLQHERDPGFCLRPRFVDGVVACGQRQLTFDVCVRHPQLGAIAELARRAPETTLVLDHAGKPGIAGGLLDPWRATIAELGRLPNVVCKLSGLVTEADPVAFRLDDLRPYAEHVLACFGPERVLFGSDWPVLKLAATYERWLDMALSLLAPLSESERHAVLAGNASRVYRLT